MAHFEPVFLCFEFIWSCRGLCLYRYFWSLAQYLFDFRNIFCFLSDVLSSGIWLEAASLTNSSLSDMIPGLIDLQLGAKAPSTVLKYKSG